MCARILPKYQKYYQYLSLRPENGLQHIVTIDTPPDIRASDIQIDFNREAQTINVHYLDLVPFLCGQMKGNVTGYSTLIYPSENQLIINFTLTERLEITDLFICDYHPLLRICDPYSLLKLFLHKGRETVTRNDIAKLDLAAKMGFLPAIQELYINFIYSKFPIKLADEYALELAEGYKPSQLHFYIACAHFHEKTEEDYHIAYQHFLKSEEYGGFAKDFLGLYYSPISYIPFPNKDGKIAAECFEKTLEKDPKNVISLHNLSLLLYQGIGVEKDVKRAQELYNTLVTIDPHFPPLEDEKIIFFDNEGKDDSFNMNDLYLILGIGAAIGVGAFCFYKIWKRLQRK
ncbi:hypothetical protein TVAG_090120 [Trichomonas vaginalis G3]|uniref:TPR Domain containing protein n=1 Tax=Trichomonas vaginalis (strain ATCC PRA-98 / G3) TaxID=412133 RepID=A2EZN9_TRIV3|nr:HCP-like family [Trichomonas vaginalis G3]EAY01877.1 hypothetical protein TVAG_090120 [Trichomonas vaginalis G3]KAI5549676.1 HCP-like family [Trichomonas vaginalis G3]|eukprot:XP_001314421.1 hypothetical protein [Trichomonas vaginalis G3]